MATNSRSDTIRIVGDFVCETIPDSPVPLDKPAARGKSEGVRVINEFVVELGSNDGAGLEATSDQTDNPDSHQRALSPGQDAALKSAIEPLATYISASSDPRGAMIHAMELLVAELNNIDQATAVWLRQLRPAGRPATRGTLTDGESASE